jgi:putative DNA primase/helicase
MTNTTLSNRDQTTTLETQNHLCSQHYRELIEKRSLPLDWVIANCKSVTIQEASEVLGYPAKSPGILLQGDGWQIQYKPDKPWTSDKDKALGNKKAPKYRTPQEYEGDYDAIAPTHPTDKTFWNDLEKLKERCWKVQGHHCILVTEGLFKAISATSEGIPTIALLGIEMGLTSSRNDPQGKRYLVKTLEKFAKEGFGFIIAFDADCVTNKNVIEAERKLIHQLRKFGVPVYSITGKWSMDDGKGMDDFIKQKGIETFKQVLADITEQYKEPDGEDNKKEKKPPTPKQLAKKLAEEYQPQWAFHGEQDTWRIFNGKIWEAFSIKDFMKLLFDTVESRGIEYNTPSYLKNVAELLEWQLRVKKWNTFDRKNWIAFNNGVLEVATGEVHKHSPGFRFISHLQRDYRPLTLSTEPPPPIQLLANNCPAFYQWAMEAMNNDESKVLKLLAIVNGVIKFRFYDLQMFVYLVGKPGTGKGTFCRLLEKIVGQENHTSSRLEKLGDDYEIAKNINMQLVTCPDEDKQLGKYGDVKAYTGGDTMSYREIYKSPSASRFYGTLVITSNSSIFTGDTSGLDRRLCLNIFNNKIPSYKRSAAIEKVLESELTALTSVALAMQDDEVTQRIRGIGEAEIPEFKREDWLLKCDVNSVAAWANQRIIHDPDSYEFLSDLYEDYRTYCGDSGQKAVADKKLCSNILQVSNEVMGWEDVVRDRKAAGTIIRGIRLRKGGSDDDKPWIEELFAPPESKIPSALCTSSEDTNEVAKLIQSKASVGNVDELPNFLENKKALQVEEQDKPDNLKVLPEEIYIAPELAPSKESSCEAVSTSPSTLPEILPPTTEPLQVPAVDELKGWGRYNKVLPYPNPKSDNERSSQKRSLAIRESFRASNTVEDLFALNRDNGGEFSKDELTWVKNWIKLFFPTEFSHLQATAKITQLGLEFT